MLTFLSYSRKMVKRAGAMMECLHSYMVEQNVKTMLGYWHLTRLSLDLFLNLALDKFGLFRPKGVLWRTGHGCCTGHTYYAGCTFHACGSNSSYKGGPSLYCMFVAASISPLKRGRWGGINSCAVGTVGGPCLAAGMGGLVFFWPAEIKDLAFFLAGWQLWGTPAACQWWWSSAHCNVEGISWLLEAASWQLYLWEVN